MRKGSSPKRLREIDIAALLSLGWRKLVARQTRKAEEREGVTPVRESRHQTITLKRNHLFETAPGRTSSHSGLSRFCDEAK